jgi:hypothetical protein
MTDELKFYYRFMVVFSQRIIFHVDRIPGHFKDIRQRFAAGANATLISPCITPDAGTE